MQGPVLPGTARRTHRRQVAHQQLEDAAGVVIHRRRARRGRNDLGIYQRIFTAYPEPDKKFCMQQIPALMGKLGRTLKKRAVDILAFFDRPSTSNGVTEATTARLEHLRGSAWSYATLRIHPELAPRSRRIQSPPVLSVPGACYVPRYRFVKFMFLTSSQLDGLGLGPYVTASLMSTDCKGNPSAPEKEAQ